MPESTLPTRLIAGTAAGAALLLSAACGSEEAVAPRTAYCAFVPDLSVSASSVTARATQLLSSFVLDQGCASVQVVPITSNSSGEACTVPAVDLLDLTAAPDNPAGAQAEITDEKLPLVLQQVASLNQCVTANGTDAATDVAGAFRQAGKLANGAPVTMLVISDLVHNVGFDMVTTALESDAQRSDVAADLAAQLPDMAGWSVTAAGVAAGTSAMTPTQSDSVQAVWESAVREKGASWHRTAV